MREANLSITRGLMGALKIMAPGITTRNRILDACQAEIHESLIGLSLFMACEWRKRGSLLRPKEPAWSDHRLCQSSLKRSLLIWNWWILNICLTLCWRQTRRLVKSFQSPVYSDQRHSVLRLQRSQSNLNEWIIFSKTIDLKNQERSNQIK